jgi:hypothetical protein
VDSRASSGELLCFAPYGEGYTLESILLISPEADLSDPVSFLYDAEIGIYNSLPGCRRDMVSRGMGCSSTLGLQTQQMGIQR